MSDFHLASPRMALLRLCRIKNDPTETKNCYSSLNGELRCLVADARNVGVDTIVELRQNKLRLSHCCHTHVF